jgi:hypothetical protein
MEQNTPIEADSSSPRKLVEQDLLRCSQHPVTGHNHEPHESSPHTHSTLP